MLVASRVCVLEHICLPYVDTGDTCILDAHFTGLQRAPRKVLCCNCHFAYSHLLKGLCQALDPCTGPLPPCPSNVSRPRSSCTHRPLPSPFPLLSACQHSGFQLLLHEFPPAAGTQAHRPPPTTAPAAPALCHTRPFPGRSLLAHRNLTPQRQCHRVVDGS